MPIDCGYLNGCVMYDISGTSLDWVPSCVVPNTSPYWATTWVSAGSYYNVCPGLGSDQGPVFVISVDPSQIGTDWWKNQHVGRHELGHALALGEAYHSCWNENGGVFPLMNNGPCPNAKNIYATQKEVTAVINRNWWW